MAKRGRPRKVGGVGDLSTENKGVHPPTPEIKSTGTLHGKNPIPEAPSLSGRNVITLRPQSGPQEEFLSSPEDEILFGGSKGGGKSFALILAALRQISTPGYKGIIFRRTYPKLSELIDRSHQIFPHLGGRWFAKDYRWLFPSGATIKFAHCQNEEDKYIYQGHEYHFMGFDQVEEFTESMYMFLVAQVRNPPPGVFKQIVSTANPGGIGHAWVYRRFMVDPLTNEEVPPGFVIKEKFKLPFDINTRKKGDELTRTRVFIPATVYDNKILLENDPGYLTNLMQLPEAERKALLEGDWHVFAGQYFKEWSTARHVIDPIEIQPNWIRFRAIDYGSTAPFCCLWGAVDEMGNIYWYREYYASGYTARQNGKKVAELSADESYAFTVADPSIFSKTGQDYTIAEVMMEEGVNGIEPGSNDRISGWQEVKFRLSWNDATGKAPTMFFFSSCINSIRTIPGLIHDDRRPEDLNSDGEDHAADTCRYGVVRLRNNVARAMDTTKQNQSGLKFGLPVSTWRQAEEFGGAPHPYQIL